MEAPPSIGRITPATNFAAGEQRYTAAQPMSLGSPKRAIGVRERILFEGWQVKAAATTSDIGIPTTSTGR